MSGPVITSPEDIVNAALSRIGVKQRIGSMLEGSEPSKIALDVYGQTRDELLRDGDWGFARRDLTLTLLKSAPAAGYIPPTVWSTTYPPLPWKYEYTYPSDCLKLRSIRKTPLFLPDFDPQPVVFDTPNDDGYTPPVKVIVCNVASAIATYTGQVTNPATWEASFVEEMIAAMARRMAPAFNAQLEQAEATDEVVTAATANMTQG